MTIDFDTIGIGEKAAAGAGPALGTATMRERDSTKQIRLPLREIPEVLSKLCSPHPLCWDDLYAVYGEQPSAPAPAPGSDGSAAAMLAYLSSHGVSAKLNAAVNELAKVQPADPMGFLVQLLTKK